MSEETIAQQVKRVSGWMAFSWLAELFGSKIEPIEDEV